MKSLIKKALLAVSYRIRIGGGGWHGKKSDTHKATIIGDTVGDPLKDVAGPSVLIFMKLLGMTSLLLLPLLTHV
jgi:K(+)-stimulated pyrophosphate-energized sodium pump